LQNAEAQVIDRGIQRSSIAAAKANLRARQLYERLGYRICREDAGDWHYVDHQGQLREVHEPCWVLEKSLDPR
jgi:ribosomal protein S18 acetylase RimI-like enzyme